MKKFALPLLIILATSFNSFAQNIPNCKENEELIVKETNELKEKTAKKPESYSSTSVASVDELTAESQKLQSSTFELQKEFMALRVRQCTKSDPNLGEVTDVKCYDADGKESECKLIPKEDRNTKLLKLLTETVTLTKSLEGLNSKLKTATTDAQSASGMSKMKAIGRTKDISKMLAESGSNLNKLTANLNASLAALKMLK